MNNPMTVEKEVHEEKSRSVNRYQQRDPPQSHSLQRPSRFAKAAGRRRIEIQENCRMC